MHIKETFPELHRIRKRPLKIEDVREKLSAKRGREYWQSLEELAGTEEFEELLHREFPQHASEWDEGTDRRTFLKLMGASLAFAGLTGCSYQPQETIVPYVNEPEGIIPGKPLFFATAMPLGGAATGLLVRSNMGRPTKVEGNPEHPGSLGATDVYSQAAILELYDPDRAKTVIERGEVRAYTAFLGAMATAMEGQRPKQGAGLRILTETIISPTAAAQIREILRAFPQARWHQWEPAGANAASMGTRGAFGDFATPIYDFGAALRVVSLDSDFLMVKPATLRYAHDFMMRRRAGVQERRDMNRLYVVETTPTNTGMLADHRLALRPSEMENFVRAIAASVGVAGIAGSELAGEQGRWAAALAADLREHGGRSIVVAGEHQSPTVHALAHAMNQALGNVGRTVTYVEPVEENPTDQLEELRTLVADIDAGRVEALVMVGGNPVYTTPTDLKLDAARMNGVPLRVHLSDYNDETSELCHWHVPKAHFLETWSDTRAYDGTATIMQPLIQPLYNGKSVHEFLAAFSDRPDRNGYDIVREYWMTEGRAAAQAPARGAAGAAAAPAQSTGPQSTPQAGAGQTGTTQQGAAAQPSPSPSMATTQPTPAAGQPPTSAAQVPARGGTAVAPPAPSADFESFWRKAIHDGVVPNTARRPKSVSVRGDFAASLGAQAPASTSTAPQGNERPLEIVFRPDPSIFDGRFANNGWLQELPKPLTKLTWDNVAIISPATAERLNFGVAPDAATHGGPVRVNRITAKGGEIRADVVRLRFRGREVEAPVWILPGQPDDTVTVHLGYGRTLSGRVGGNRREGVVGFNAYLIRTSDALWGGTGLEMTPTGTQYPLASTQIHFQMEDREIVRAGRYEEYLKDPTLAPHGVEDEHKTEGAGEVVKPPMPAGANEAPEEQESLYPNYDYSVGSEYNPTGYKWGMAIDTLTCVGCNACVIACQSENNIPVVGKEQVARSREMHWLRVDAYFRGAVENPAGVHFMPVPCMHCEKAPCEPVCPVHATVHSADGLNDMVYNRCIGTRYCSNNCPYKVRRFNFLLYQDWDTPTYKAMRNPEVSVRSRGVMEKCTYCVQRIRYADVEAEKEGRRIREGEVVTACQAACPTAAIVFGDLNNPESAVAKLQREPRTYSLLADLNTRPRTKYMGDVRNPNPALEGKA